MMAINSKHIAVVGQQRTGTTALKQCLRSAPGYFDLGEIFSIHGTDLKVNWWGWLAERAHEAPISVCPASWRELWGEYLSEQRQHLGAEHFVFDLKAEFLGQTLLADVHGQWLFFPTEDVVFVHVERRNLVAQIVSRLRAEQTQEWAWRDARAHPDRRAKHERSFERRSGDVSWQDDGQPMTPSPTLRVPLELLTSELQRVEQTSRWVAKTLEPYDVVRIQYEDLFEAESGDFLTCPPDPLHG